MKKIATLLALGLLFSLFSWNVSAQTQEITFPRKEMKISAALKVIEKQSGLTFAYNGNQLDVNKVVSVPEGKTAMEALTEILKGTGTEAQLNGNVVAIVKAGTKSVSNFLKGHVTDLSGEPLIGASVVISGTSKGAQTDMDGNFSIKYVTWPVSLNVDYLGFISKSLILTGQEPQPLNITLREDTKLLNESVVIGYGSQKKETLTGSIAVRDMAEVENRPMSHASEALYSMPGLYINQASSKPGSDGATIRIRGVGTLSSSNPMVLVDGMEYSLDDVNPDDIETISVLKDASASIYGSKAANGVILITTKSAKKVRLW